MNFIRKRNRSTDLEKKLWLPNKKRASAEVQPRLIQGIRRGDGFGEFTGYTGFNQILIRDIKSNRIRIAQ